MSIIIFAGIVTSMILSSAISGDFSKLEVGKKSKKSSNVAWRKISGDVFRMP